MAHEQYRTGTAMANLTCCKCGGVFVQSQPGGCTNATVRMSVQKREGLCTFGVRVGLRFF